MEKYHILQCIYIFIMHAAIWAILSWKNMSCFPSSSSSSSSSLHVVLFHPGKYVLLPTAQPHPRINLFPIIIWYFPLTLLEWEIFERISKDLTFSNKAQFFKVKRVDVGCYFEKTTIWFEIQQKSSYCEGFGWCRSNTIDGGEVILDPFVSRSSSLQLHACYPRWMVQICLQLPPSLLCC